MSRADYLTKKYLTADSDKKSKKRKRKNREEGLKIDDDDDIAGWKKIADDDDDDAPTLGMIAPPYKAGCIAASPLTPATVGMTLSSTKSKKKSRQPKRDAHAWKTVGVAAPSHAEQLAADKAAADAIIASAVADRKQAADDEDEAPEMVDTEGAMLESGARAGLQTAEQVAADMEKKQREEKRKAAETAKAGGPGETVYRDGSG